MDVEQNKSTNLAAWCRLHTRSILTAHKTVAVVRGSIPSAAERKGAGWSGDVRRNHRVILVELGRGRLHGPSRGLHALTRFVRERLLPQDQVAVLGYDRANDFTTDHEKVARLLER